MIITAGKYKGRKVQAPDENITRPTLSKAREAVFNVLFSLMDFEGKIFLDMFAGSGIMGLEAISRGFKHVVAVEKNHKAFRIIKENYKKLKIESKIVLKDVLKSVFEEKFDVIYLDPPYFSGIYESILKKISEENILNTNGIVILEHVVDVDWQKYSFCPIKQKEYSGKKITFLQIIK